VINNNSDASALVTASGTGTDSVGTGNTTLTGGADADPDAGSGVNIDTLRVDVDAVADEALGGLGESRLLVLILPTSTNRGALQTRCYSEHTPLLTWALLLRTSKLLKLGFVT
jgi:hypothetical protein